MLKPLYLYTLILNTLILSCSSESNDEVEIIEMSLTSDYFDAHKYYMGWGVAGRGDPNMMHNEVSYDVKHTHEIFSKDLGGSYESFVKTGLDVNRSYIIDTWKDVDSKITGEDMYVQYSSGHGSPQGLGAGVSYSEIVDHVLSLKAKEKIVFIMACYSGGLVNEFNKRKDEWGDGTLFVLASSKQSESSSTGPGTDSEEEGGPRGSSGSAYGFSLWKSLLGDADGYVDGILDGYLSLEEIRDYTTDKTVKVGGHTPQVTGQYEGGLIMNRKVR